MYFHAVLPVLEGLSSKSTVQQLNEMKADLSFQLSQIGWTEEKLARYKDLGVEKEVSDLANLTIQTLLPLCREMPGVVPELVAFQSSLAKDVSRAFEAHAALIQQLVDKRETRVFAQILARIQWGLQ